MSKNVNAVQDLPGWKDFFSFPEYSYVLLEMYTAARIVQLDLSGERMGGEQGEEPSNAISELRRISVHTVQSGRYEWSGLGGL